MTEQPIVNRRVLAARWQRAFGAPPPLHLSVGFMARALDYDRQCEAQGGLQTQTKRALRAALPGLDGPQAKPPNTALSPGAQLVREWNGRSYRVEVLPDGFRFEGEAYRSLSAIARQITGTAWSGPRFFGLTAKRAA